MPIKNASSIFLVTGMAAGFAGLFETPIAAILFAMEVLVAGSLEYQSLFLRLLLLLQQVSIKSFRVREIFFCTFF